MFLFYVRTIMQDVYPPMVNLRNNLANLHFTNTAVQVDCCQATP